MFKLKKKNIGNRLKLLFEANMTYKGENMNKKNLKFLVKVVKDVVTEIIACTIAIFVCKLIGIDFSSEVNLALIISAVVYGIYYTWKYEM